MGLMKDTRLGFLLVVMLGMPMAVTRDKLSAAVMVALTESPMAERKVDWTVD